MSENAKNKIVEELPIPEFQELKEILGCDKCELDCPCNPSNRYCPNKPNSEWTCKIIRTKFHIIEIIVGILLEAFFISISFVIFRNFWITFILAILIIAAMCWFDYEFLEGIIKEKYNKKEEKRYDEYKSQVKAIEEQNEMLIRQANGETEEYFSFKEKINKVTEQLEKRKEKIAIKEQSENEIIPEQTDSKQKVKENFEELLTNLKELNNQILPLNFEYVYVQTFYTVHIPSLIENMDIYFGKISEGSLTDKEEESFERLIEAFKSRIEQIIQGLKEQGENNFLIKMESLQEAMNSLGNKSKED